MKLSRTDWKYTVDTLMFLCLVGIVLIGLLMGFVIPEGRLGPGQSKYFLGVHRHQWGNVHLYLSLAFTALIIVHIVLAWSWTKGKAKGLFGKPWKVVVGLTVVAAVFVPLVFWLAAPKNDPAYAEFGEGRDGQGRRFIEAGRTAAEPLNEATILDSPRAPAAGQEQSEEAVVSPRLHEEKTVAGRQEAGTAEVVITGKMTLREVERATGIPAKDLAAKVGLPGDVSLDETIGRLRQAYQFEMQAIRDAIAEILKAKRSPWLP